MTALNVWPETGETLNICLQVPYVGFCQGDKRGNNTDFPVKVSDDHQFNALQDKTYVVVCV